MIDAMPFNRRKGKSAPLSERDYVGFPLPRNLPAAPHGNCLIWLGSLNVDGYGAGTFPSGEKLAHREAFRDSRGYAGENVLHLCHRPYCIQPSHLYAGSKQDNADDRRLRQLNFPSDWPLFERAADEVRKAARYQWSRPKVQQAPMLSTDVDHDCEFVVPAGREKICSICSEPESPQLRGGPALPAFQPDNADINKSQVIATNRRFTDVRGFTVESNTAVSIEVPTTRAEKRRFDRKQRKLAKRKDADKPRLLSTHSGLIGPDGLHIQDDMPVDVQGPGFVVWTADIRPVPPELAAHSAKQRGSRT